MLLLFLMMVALTMPLSIVQVSPLSVMVTGVDFGCGDHRHASGECHGADTARTTKIKAETTAPRRGRQGSSHQEFPQVGVGSLRRSLAAVRLRENWSTATVSPKPHPQIKVPACLFRIW